MLKNSAIVFAISIMMITGSLATASSFALPDVGKPDFVPGRYIVVLEDGVSTSDVVKGHGLVPEFIYDKAITGFAGPIPLKTVENLQNDSRVKYIEKDQRVYAFAQSIPTGIDRIDAEPSDSSNLGSSVTIAVIDTGIDLDHNDLNVVHSVNCSGGGPFGEGCGAGGDDDNGHGTHVAGSAAGLNNNLGVVGVAPGADLWAVKVLDHRGSGYMSWIIAGVNYVTDNADTVDVANMSLGCECSSSALDEAISSSVAAGVTYVVAAGNSEKDASAFSPANHEDVITVSAVADSNGMCGGGGPDTSYGDDDTLATFSNFGSAVEIAAPGVDIYSTYPGGSYATFSGTSMASPHVAGAAALIVANNPEILPADVLVTLLNNAVPQGQICNGDGDGGFTENTGDGSAEPLVYVGNTSELESDEVAPVISGVSASTTSDSATVTWTTDEPATSRVDYGLDTNYDSYVSSDSFVTSHSLEITGLSSSTTYYFSVTSTDSTGNSASSGDYTFETTAPPTLESIEVTPVDSSIEEGSNQQFTATGHYSDGSSSDITNSVTWTSTDDTIATIDSSGLATGMASGTVTITAESDSISGSTSLTVNPASSDPTTVGVTSIEHSTEGGKNKDKHLNSLVTVQDDVGNFVSGATVYTTLNNTTTGTTWIGSATTGDDGKVLFSLKNAPSGCYQMTIDNVVIDGLTWDGQTPANSKCK